MNCIEDFINEAKPALFRHSGGGASGGGGVNFLDYATSLYGTFIDAEICGTIPPTTETI